MNSSGQHTDLSAPQKRPFSIWRFFKRLLLTLIISVVFLLGLCIVLVYVYEEDVKKIMITELNKHLQAEIRVEPQNIDLAFIRTFPKCALEFKKVTAMEALKTKEKDTLFYADNISLSFSLKDLFNKNYSIKQILVSKGVFNLAVDKNGEANYIAWKADSSASSGNVKFALEKISLKDVDLNYKNAKAKIRIRSHIKQVEFKGLFNNEEYALSSKGQAFITLMQVQKTKYINNKNLSFTIDMDVSGKAYHFKQADLRLNEMSFKATGDMVYRDSLENLNIEYAGKNLEIASVLSILPERHRANISDYSSEGLFYASGIVNYKHGNPLSISSDFGIRQATITYKPQSTKLTDVNLTGKFILKDKVNRLSLKDISANLGHHSLKGNCELINFNDPYITLNADVNANLQELIQFYPIDTIQTLSGDLQLNASIEGFIKNMKRPASSSDIQAHGTATLHNLKVKFKNSTKELNVPEGEVQLHATDLQVTKLKIIHGNSDLTLVGIMPAFLNYMFDHKAALNINATLSSSKLELEDFLVPSTSGGYSTVNIPANLDFNLDATIGHFSFSKCNADHIKGNIYIKDQKVFIKNLSLEAMDGKATLNAFADASGTNIKISGESDLVGINIQKLFYQLNNFGQTTLQDKQIRGFVTANIDFVGTWSKQLEADLGSINATSSLLIERGEVIGFKPLESLAKYIEVKELQHIKFSTLQSGIEIKNKTIILPKTSIKSNAINIELYGKHGFDNVIDYHIRLLLSELLAKRPRANKQLDDELSRVENDPENKRSVFIMMTGPIDNPTIKYDKKSAKEKIKQDIKQEKQNLKQILKEEFGLFKKDSLVKKETHLQDQKFKLEDAPGNKKPKPALQAKKKEEDDDF